jgi:rhodanese-related sulfurtransferase
MKTIAPAQLHQLLKAQPDLQLLDVRTPVEYAEIHAHPARNVPLDSLAPKKLFGSGDLAEDQAVYLLCRTGGRAKKAAEKFVKEGFPEAVVVEGGTLAWNEAGLPVERGPVKVISLERQVRMTAGSLVLSGILLGSLVHRGFFGLSAFVGAGLVFAGITDFCGMGLLLSKPPWNTRKTV